MTRQPELSGFLDSLGQTRPAEQPREFHLLRERQEREVYDLQCQHDSEIAEYARRNGKPSLAMTMGLRIADRTRSYQLERVTSVRHSPRTSS